jgi:hypothetical protein
MMPGLRKFILTAHITTSVGWIGAAIAYLTLDLTVTTSQDTQMLRAAWIAMGLISSYAILPLSFASLVTGLVLSIGTPWGLFRHYWVVISLVLTVFAILVLLSEVQVIRHIAADATTSNDDLRALPNTLLHSAGGSVLLILITLLNVYKPRGLTPYGWRKQQEQRSTRQAVGSET